MLQLWIDTETTGKDPAISGAFEIAVLVFEDGNFREEKVWHLNPLTETILFSDEAYRINGVSEETIRSYPPAETVVREIASCLATWVSHRKFVFCGYSASFDYEHIKALFDRCGIQMNDFFDGRIIDVYQLVKKARAKKVVGFTQDNKLQTITKALGIPHESAHTALSDIWATRKLYEVIYRLERGAK